MNVSDFIDRLDGVRRAGAGFSARCPAHDDHRQSLSVSAGDDGRVLIKCHAGCPADDVLAKLGLALKDLYPDQMPALRVAPRQGPKTPKPKLPPLTDEQVRGWQAALRADVGAWRHVTETLGFTPEQVLGHHLGLAVNAGRRWLMYPYIRAGRFTYAKGRSIDGDKDFWRWPAGQESGVFGGDTLDPGGTAIVTEGERDAVAARVLGLHTELGGSAGCGVISMPDGATPKPPKCVLDALARVAVIYLALDGDGPGDVAADALATALGPVRCRRVRLPRHKDLGDLLSAASVVEGQAEALRAFREADERATDPAGLRAQLRASICRFTADELRSEPPAQRFILRPYIPAERVTTLSGPGGSSKTTMLVYLAVCRALGRPFFGRTLPAEGRTVIVTTEDSRDDYHRKLAAIRCQLGEDFDAQAVADSIVLLDLSGIPIRMVETHGGNWTATPYPDHLAAILKTDAPGADLVIMETVSRLAGGVETNESLSILVEAAQRLCRLASAAVVLVAHVSQEAGRMGIADQYAARGGSSLGDNGRSSVVLTRLNANNRKQFAPDADLTPDDMERLLVLTHPKSNGAPCAKPLVLERIGTPYAGVLQPAALRTADEQQEDQRERLLSTIAELTAVGIICTRTSMRQRAKSMGVARDDLDSLIDAAVKSGNLAERVKPGRGGGLMLVPTANPAANPADEDRGSAPASSADLSASDSTPRNGTEKKSAEEVRGNWPRPLTLCEVEEGDISE